MRKLPIYLLLDTSASMTGEPIQQVQEGVENLVAALRQDPQALETAWLSVITFDQKAEQLVPLTELVAFQSPKLAARGMTSMGEALSLVADRAATEVVRGTSERKGDWRPMVFIMTDGYPNDDFEQGLRRFQQEKWGVVVGCAVDGGDPAVLKRIAGEAVVQLSTESPGAMAAFFQWVSSSVRANSQRVNLNKEPAEGLDELPPPPPEISIAAE